MATSNLQRRSTNSYPRREEAEHPDPVHGPVADPHAGAGRGGVPGHAPPRGAGRELRPAILHGARSARRRARRCGPACMPSTPGCGTTPTSPGSASCPATSRRSATCCASRATTPPSRASGTSRRCRRSEDALERYGFSDFQQWGEMFGAPLEGAQLDGAAAFETVDWLEHKAPTLDRPWLLVCSLVNPHDVMFLQTDPVAEAAPERLDGGPADDRAAARLVRARVGRRAAGQLRRRLRAPAVRRAALQGKHGPELRAHSRRPHRPLAQAPQLPRSTACAWWMLSSAGCSQRWTAWTCGRTPS